MTKDERLWTRREVAEYLGVAVRSIAALGVPRVALQGSGQRPIVRFDPAEVKAWVAHRKSRTLLAKAP